jgi:hypothetical protein
MVIYSYFSHLLWGENSWHQMDRRLAKTQRWYECGGKGKALPCLEIKIYHLA